MIKKKDFFASILSGVILQNPALEHPSFRVFFCIMKLIVIKIYPTEHKADEVCVLGRMAEERGAILFKIPDLLSLCSMV